MSYTTRSYVVNNITLPINASGKEAFAIAAKRLRAIGVTADTTSMTIYRRSVDARKRNDIKFVYSVLANGATSKNEADISAASGILQHDYADPQILIGDTKLESEIIVVGSGPCGLFAALLLAENGYKPILIEHILGLLVPYLFPSQSLLQRGLTHTVPPHKKGLFHFSTVNHDL